MGSLSRLENRRGVGGDPFEGRSVVSRNCDDIGDSQSGEKENARYDYYDPLQHGTSPHPDLELPVISPASLPKMKSQFNHSFF